MNKETKAKCNSPGLSLEDDSDDIRRIDANTDYLVREQAVLECFRSYDAFLDQTTYTLCAQCGFEICPEDAVLRILSTGDLIHRDCWNDYAEDNADDFTEVFELSGRE